MFFSFTSSFSFIHLFCLFCGYLFFHSGLSLLFLINDVTSFGFILIFFTYHVFMFCFNMTSKVFLNKLFVTVNAIFLSYCLSLLFLLSNRLPSRQIYTTYFVRKISNSFLLCLNKVKVTLPIQTTKNNNDNKFVSISFPL